MIMAWHWAGCTFFLFLLLSLLTSEICFGSLRELSGRDVLGALETSCVVAVTEHASTELYNTVQYLADVSFREDNGVVIGYLFVERFQWKDGQTLSRQNKQDSLLYFRRRVVDRTCLLTPGAFVAQPPANPIPEPAQQDATSLVGFINEVCNVFRSKDGDISAAGIHRQYILQNLFFVESITNVSMGHLYGLTTQESENVTRDDNSFCPKAEDNFYSQSGAGRGGFINQCYDQCYRTENNNRLVTSDTLNRDSITECTKIDLPSYEEFFENYLQKSKPVIIKNVTQTWPAYHRWSNDLLRELFGEVKVHIKLSPNGEYEGVEPAKLWEDHKTFNIPPAVRSQLQYPDLVVVRPATMDIKFSEFLDLVENISRGSVKNLSAYLEYTSMAEYFKEILGDAKEMPFISNILTLKHKNIWLSDGNTLGKLHFDPFDNFLCQLSGQKELILFGPHDNSKLYEAHIPEALLGFNRNTSTFRRKTLLDSTSMVMSPVDPLEPDFQRFPGFAEAFPMNCTIDEGEVLYLPAFWWHEVQSRPSPKDQRNLAVNYWYEPFLTREFPCPECKLDVNPVYSHLL